MTTIAGPSLVLNEFGTMVPSLLTPESSPYRPRPSFTTTRTSLGLVEVADAVVVPERRSSRACFVVTPLGRFASDRHAVEAVTRGLRHALDDKVLERRLGRRHQDAARRPGKPKPLRLSRSSCKCERLMRTVRPRCVACSSPARTLPTSHRSPTAASARPDGSIADSASRRPRWATTGLDRSAGLSRSSTSGYRWIRSQVGVPQSSSVDVGRVSSRRGRVPSQVAARAELCRQASRQEVGRSATPAQSPGVTPCRRPTVNSSASKAAAALLRSLLTGVRAGQASSLLRAERSSSGVLIAQPSPRRGRLVVGWTGCRRRGRRCRPEAQRAVVAAGPE